MIALNWLSKYNIWGKGRGVFKHVDIGSHRGLHYCCPLADAECCPRQVASGSWPLAEDVVCSIVIDGLVL